jgi:adenosylcobinamide-GDP ribazoletransferase
MVTCAWLGRPASSGLGSVFVKSMRHKHALFSLSLITAFVIGFLSLGFAGLLTTLSGVFVGLLMIGLSNKVFGWMTGDVFGASNELARMTALSCLVVQQWI